MRRVISFACAGQTLIGSLDEADGETGLLIVSGGNEPRMGAHRGMALLAARLAAAGTPVFRFDRRGVGDSGGENGGWASSAPDLCAAAAAFRAAAPRVTRLVGFGNCDAATTLALFGKAAGVEAVVLANPWVVERAADDLPPVAAIRQRYAQRLRSPRQWLSWLRHGVDLPKLCGGLRAIAGRPAEPELAHRFALGLHGRTATVILARGDATAIGYADATASLGIAARTVTVPTASHSFAREEDGEALFQAVHDAVGRCGATDVDAGTKPA